MTNYLTAREHYLIARAKYNRHEAFLQDLLGATDTGASLEAAMLEARTEGKHLEPIMKLSILGTELDKASNALDLATELQRRKIAAQEAAFNQNIRNLDE